jgi:hypothetical protein
MSLQCWRILEWLDVMSRIFFAPIAADQPPSADAAGPTGACMMRWRRLLTAAASALFGCRDDQGNRLHVGHRLTFGRSSTMTGSALLQFPKQEKFS